MSKKSKTKTTQNSTVTTTPVNPEWSTSAVTGLQDKINQLRDSDAASLVPGASQLQTQAFNQASQLGGGASAAQGLLDADPIGVQSASSRGILDVDLEGYQNPFEDQVIDTTLAGLDEQSAMKAAALAGQQAAGRKFSGSGSAIESALFKRGALQDRASTEAGLRSAGFDKATGLATSDLNREAEISRFNAAAANAAAIAERQADLQAAGLLGSETRADLGVLAGLGDEQREIEREKLGANAELLKLVSALQGNQPYALFRGETQTGQSTGTSTSKTSDPLGSIGGILGGLGSAASGLGALGVTLSDTRLKEDIKTEGQDASGRRVVSFRYKGEPKGVRRTGHLAQEVEKTDPDAIRKIGKFKAIDYSVLEGV